MSKNFDWKRFWCPRGESIDLSDGGFLYDPEGKYGKYVNAKLVTFDKLAEQPCLALLGEPGIGKSWTLRPDGLGVRGSLPAEAEILYLDLRSFGDEGRLLRSLFESEVFQSWRTGDRFLYVFLDSLDECLLRIDHAAALLADEFPKHPVHRLRLRIACRTAPWPMLLEKALVNMFGECGVYEMAPLRRCDVLSAAQQSGVADANAFLRRIDELDVSSLAIKPVTLKFLLSTYLRDGDFPKNHIDLYEKGCRVLCEEPSPSRHASGRRGLLSPDERLAIASRVAAVTQFGNRFAVYTGLEVDGVLPEDVSLDELSGGVEKATGDVQVTQVALREVLDTGLFSARGVNRIGWAHQTYAEFLTARYCKCRTIPLEQIRPLLFHPSDEGRKLIPQLHEVAAWMSVTNPEVLKAVAVSDPEALLGAAAASLTAEQRSVVVDSLLQQASEGRPLHLRWGLAGAYHKLKHPGLRDQLRPYLTDSQKVLGARHVAISIASACGIEELGPELADIALDRLANQQLRNHAGAAAAEVGARDLRAKLRSLAFGDAGDDPEDELKGSGLKALWPDLISADELFALLTTPKQPNLSGTYSSFFYYHVVQKLKVSDLPAALAWFSKQGPRMQLIGPVDDLMDRVVEFAWDHVHQEVVARALANALLSRLRLYDELVNRDVEKKFYTKIQQDAEGRRAVLKELLPQLSLGQCGALFTSGRPFLTASDCEWYVGRVLGTSPSESRSVDARLARLTFDSADHRSASILYEACQKNEILKAECGNIFAPILLDSEEAKVLREDHMRQKEWRTPKLIEPSPAERLEKNLQNVEAGRVVEWVQLARDLGLEPTSTHYPYDPQLNLTESPGWKAAETSDRERILCAAVRYIEEGDPENDKWFETTSIYGTAIAGFQALALLAIVREESLNAVNQQTWRKWVPILIRFPFGDTHGVNLQARLLKRAYELVPDEVVSRILRVIDFENERSGHLFVTREIELCWGEHIEKALLDKAASPTLKPNIFGSLLDLLLRHGTEGARELAESNIDPSFLGEEPKRGREIAAAQMLMRHAPDGGWSLLWPLIKGNAEFGRELIESLSFPDGSDANIAVKLSESQLGELFVWLTENYPYTERPLGFGFMGPGDTAPFFRDSILEHLKKRGTFAACDAIRNFMERFPEYTWMRQPLEEAEWFARAATWRPVSIHEFMALAMDSDKRLVETGGDLIEVILESLRRLDATFHGELPAAKYLWNEWQKMFRPKDEQDLSDYVARHLTEDLRDRGIVVNREVQIRRGKGRGTGQLTDIHVDAVIKGAQPGTYETIYVIIEVKGNWHPELWAAMETQLRDRYLKENPCRDGIYLVGWFSCLKWDDTDNRKKQAPSIALSDAAKTLENQAVKLSTDGYLIRSYVLDLTLREAAFRSP